MRTNDIKQTFEFKSALTHHRRRLVVVWPAAIVRPPRVGSAISFPLPVYPVYTADANGGLCIGRCCVDALGAWGPSATNKLRRVYTGALLATNVRAYKEG